jgi:hypothetical protein
MANKTQDNHHYSMAQCGTPFWSAASTPYDPKRIGFQGEFGGIGMNVSAEKYVYAFFASYFSLFSPSTKHKPTNIQLTHFPTLASGKLKKPSTVSTELTKSP